MNVTKRECQKVYMVLREVHEQLAGIQPEIERLSVKSCMSFYEIQDALRLYHNMARINEEDTQEEMQIVS